MDSLVSIIIVNYNSGDYLRRCVSSLEKSTIPFELVIVDNASQDNSLDGISDLSDDRFRFQIIGNTENLGFSRAVNIGARHANGEFLFLLNPDSIVRKTTLEHLLAVFQDQPKTGIAGALVQNEDGSEQRGCRRNEPTFIRSVITVLKLNRWFEGVDMVYQPLPKTNQPVDAVSGAAMMVSRACFEEVGGMDEGYFLHCEDLDLCRSVRDSGYQVMFCPDIPVVHRQGASDASSFFVERHKHAGMIRYYHKHRPKQGLNLGYPMVIALVHMHFALICVTNGWSRLRGTDQVKPS